ncbi:MAG: hypothetical protein AAFQ80_15600 [Cyanobacteria bacterium J06621_8]
MSHISIFAKFTTAPSGEGSWWILVAGIASVIGLWLLRESFSWLYRKSLDKLLDKSKANNSLPKLDTVEIEPYYESNDKLSSSNIKKSLNLLDFLNSSNARKVTFTGWDQNKGGTFIKVEKGSQVEPTIHIHQTTDKNDIDNFLPRNYEK